MFRDLTADEIECRVAQITDKGCTLLLYKDARVDMNILDETFGVCGWQREHTLIGDRLYCTVKIRDKDTGEWIAKQDVGTESYTEKEKGQASDSFKRACVNIGIGRELYTAPLIRVYADKYQVSQKNGKPTTYDRFKVSDIAIKDKKITGLIIINQRTNAVVYTFGSLYKNDAPAPKPAASKGKAKKFDPNKKINAATVEALEELIAKTNSDRDAMLGLYGVDKLEDMTNAMANDCGETLKGMLNGQ